MANIYILLTVWPWHFFDDCAPLFRSPLHYIVTSIMVQNLASSTSGLYFTDRFEQRCDTPPDFPYHVCQDFWFSDGNVILSAGSFAFKVHRGQLERHADIFRTMLSIPQPENTDCTIRLCDSPTDVYHLLRALYDGLCDKQFHFLPRFYRLMIVRASTCAQILPGAIRPGLSISRFGSPSFLQVLHLYSAETMSGAPPNLLPHDPHRVGSARTDGT
jgi:hypothetical protein